MGQTDEEFKESIKKITDPCFIINHPLEISPLAKKSEQDPNKASRFQLVIAGIELGNAFSELNDPLQQAERFKEQAKSKKIKKDEKQPYDKDFVEALEYGMPPAAGFGIGLDRLVALLTDSHSLREIILFPTMRPKK